MAKLIIKNGTLVNPAGTQGKLDILMDGGKVKKIAADISPEGARVIDAAGLFILPGLVDMHCHLREPGFEHKETVATGTLAAAHGGFTTVCAMPNTNPVCDSAAVVRHVKALASEAGFAHVHPIGAITKGSLGQELSEAGELKAAGAVALSDDGKPVASSAVMRRAIQYASGFNLLVISHCEDMSLADGYMNEGVTSTLLGLRGIPAAAEEIMLAREILLAEGLALPVHIAHISTRGSVELIRAAKARGVKVSSETCPHYFSATEALCEGYDTNAKVNPPLRTQRDVEAIIEGLCDGTIDAIATDHAPHHFDDKLVEFASAANGISGFETAFGLAITNLVAPGHITLERLTELMAINPAKLLGLNAGVIAEGGAADIIIVDTAAKYSLSANDLYSKGKNSPFLDKPLTGRVLCTLVDGNVVIYNAKKAEGTV